MVEVVKAEEEESSDDSSDNEGEVTASQGKETGDLVTKPARNQMIAALTAKAAQSGSCESIQRPRARKRAHISESEASEEDASDKNIKNRKKTNKRTKKQKQKSKKEWVVPDSAGSSADELEYMRGKGLRIVHDYWPSPWRVMAAAVVNNDRINKTVSYLILF